MQLSKTKLETKIKKTMFDTFHQTLGDLRGKKEAEIFLNNFLTKMEKAKLAKRLMIAVYLEKNKSYDFIKKNLRVSSATIANVDKMMANNGGFSLALERIEIEEWATRTARKINNFLKRLTNH